MYYLQRKRIQRVLFLNPINNPSVHQGLWTESLQKKTPVNLLLRILYLDGTYYVANDHQFNKVKELLDQRY